MRKLLFLLILLPSTIFAESDFFYEDFEGTCPIGSKISSSDWYRHDSGRTLNIAKCSTIFSGSKKQSMKSVATFPPDFRTQVVLRSTDNITYLNPGFVDNQDYWIGFSIYLDSWPNESEGKSELLADLHHRPDSCDIKHDETFNLRIKNGKWHIKLNGQDGKSFCNSTFSKHFDKTVLPITEGEWTDFVLHIKPSFNGTGKGRVWINGKLVADVQNKNIGFKSETGKGDFLKLGIYRGVCRSGKPCIITTRTAYYDDFKIAKGGPSENLFNLVNPNNNLSSTNTSKKVAPPNELRIIQN